MTPLETIQSDINVHRHDGLSSQRVDIGYLSNVYTYKVSYSTTTISNGTSTVRDFATSAARFNDFTLCAAPYSLNRVIVTSYVGGKGTTTVMAHNQSNATVTLNQGTWTIKVIKF